MFLNVFVFALMLLWQLAALYLTGYNWGRLSTTSMDTQQSVGLNGPILLLLTILLSNVGSIPHSFILILLIQQSHRSMTTLHFWGHSGVQLHGHCVYSTHGCCKLCLCHIAFCCDCFSSFVNLSTNHVPCGHKCQASVCLHDPKLTACCYDF